MLNITTNHAITYTNITSLCIISILKGFIAKLVDERNISVVCKIIVELMLLEAFSLKLKIAQI